MTIDDELFAKAVALAEPGIERSELLRQCIQAFIQRQTARRLAALGGQAPEIEAVPRRQFSGESYGEGIETHVRDQVSLV